MPDKFSLRWLFDEYDFAQYVRPTIETVISTSGKQNKIESAIFIDAPSRSQFVGFYLPNDVDTYAVCKMLLGAASLLIANFASSHELLGYGIFDKSQTPFKDLASTGRVYVYYEGILSLQEESELTTLFESRHLGLILRGDDWLRTSILSIKQQTSTAALKPEDKLPGKPAVETRTYLLFDGNTRFPQNFDRNSRSLSPERNFRVGEQLFFNYFIKAIGPNPIQVFAHSRWIYLEPDVEDKTQQEMIKDFKQRIARERKAFPRLGVDYTVMYQGDADSGQWNSVFAYDKDGRRHLVTQRDLDDFKRGGVRVFVVIQVPYKDNGNWHYLRMCQYLVLPAMIPEVWHFCDYFTNSD